MGQQDDENRRSVERVKIKQGLDEARSVFNKGGDLPAYLEKALIKYEAAFWARVERRLIAPKLVKRGHDRGLPLSKHLSYIDPLSYSDPKSTTPGPSAYEDAANKLGVSMSTVERAYSDYPPSHDDTALPAKRGPVLASKKTPEVDRKKTKVDFERLAKKRALSEKNKLRLFGTQSNFERALALFKRGKTSKR